MKTTKYVLKIELILATADSDSEGQAGVDRKIKGIIDDVQNGSLPSWCIRSDAKITVEEVSHGA